MRQMIEVYKGREIWAVIRTEFETKNSDGTVSKADNIDDLKLIVDSREKGGKTDKPSIGTYASLFKAQYPESWLFSGDKLKFCRVCIYGGKCPYGHDHALMTQTRAIADNPECRRCWEAAPEVKR